MAIVSEADDRAGEDLTPSLRSRRRRRAVAWGVSIAVVAALGAGGVALGFWLEERRAISELARADADALQGALDDAVSADEAFAESSAIVLEYLEVVAAPAYDVVAASTAEFSSESVDQLGGAIDGAREAAESPLDGSTAARPEVQVEALRAATASDRESSATALGAADGACCASLEDVYLASSSDDRDVVRSDVAREVERLKRLAETLTAADTALRAAVDEVDAAIVSVARAGVETGGATRDGLDYVGDAERASLQQTLDRLSEIAAVELPIPWTARADGATEQDPFAGVTGDAKGYADAAAAARVSHEANTPPPPPPPSGGGGGGGGGGDGGGGGVCYYYDPLGLGAIVIPC